MRKNKLSILSFVALVVPALLVYWPVIFVASQSWGDAPHFVGSEFNDLLTESYAWISRGENLGGVDPRLWIKPLLLIYGYLGTLGISNGWIVNGLFYVPAIVLSFTGPVFLAKRLEYSGVVQFFAALLYTLNTYFILLIDGGQVGIALAYGLFPFVVAVLIELFTKPGYYKYFLSVLLLFLLTMFDPRVGILSVFVSVLWVLFTNFGKWKSVLKYTLLVGIAWLGLNAYWIVPLTRIKQASLSLTVSDLGLLSLLNGLFLYQPHWSANIFGVVTWSEWYFVGFTLLIFGGLLLRIKRREIAMTLLFLLFVFLLKGSTYPFGGIYSFAVSNLPFGSAFRDSSKFFIPLMLIGGILIGNTLVAINKKYEIGNTKKYLLAGAVYVYILLTLLPVFAGKMNFVLSGASHSQGLTTISQQLQKDSNFSRSLWFPERHPLAYETENNPALDAKSLTTLAPLANMTAGSSDMFNYIYQSEDFLNWYRLLGIKYLVLAGDTRNPNLGEEDQLAWKKLQDRLDEIDLEKSGEDVYEVSDIYPRVFFVDKMIAVVGPEMQTRFTDEGRVQSVDAYFEDGLMDPFDLEGVASDSATLVFNGTDEDDLTMSFLQDYFVGTNKAKSSDWGYYSNDRYLESKYQLLIRDIVSQEFDYGLGQSLSEKDGETLSFEVDVDQDATYILAVRSMGSGASKLGYQIGEESGEIEHVCVSEEESDRCAAQFGWFTEGVNLEKGSEDLDITNKEGLSVVNAVAIVPVEAWNEAQRMTNVFMTHFGVTGVDDVEDYLGDANYEDVEFDKRYPTWYDFTPPENAGWIVLTDSYHPDWKIRKGLKYLDSLPAYSMTNAFYVEPNWSKTRLEFVAQKHVRWGLYYSVLTALGFIIIFLWFMPTKKNRK